MATARQHDTHETKGEGDVRILVAPDPIAKITTPSDAGLSDEVVQLSKLIHEGTILGIAMCGMSPSGCFDIGKDLSFPNAPLIRVEYAENFPSYTYKFIDRPKKNSTYSSVFFTGCGLEKVSMFVVLQLLSMTYQVTGIKHVYKIVPPHHADDHIEKYYKPKAEDKEFFGKNGYEFSTVFSRVACDLPYNGYNVGIPRFQLNSSTFHVPDECQGLFRLRFITYSFEMATYLHKFFRQVINSSKAIAGKSPIVIALEVKPSEREWIRTIALQYNIKMDFCDQFPNGRLPEKEDFLKVLDVIGKKKGVVCFDRFGTQSLLQALSFGARVLIHCPNAYLYNIHLGFYRQLIDLVSKELRPTAKVILGNSREYKLLNNTVLFNQICDQLQAAVHKSHAQHDLFKSAVLQQKEKPISEIESKENKDTDLSSVIKPQSIGKIYDFSFRNSVFDELTRITGMQWKFDDRNNKFYIFLDDKHLRKTIINHFYDSLGIQIKEISVSEHYRLSLDSSLIKVSQLRSLVSFTQKALEDMFWVRSLR